MLPGEYDLGMDDPKPETDQAPPAETEDDSEPTGADPAPDEADPAKPVNPHQPDKGLQKVQQDLAAYRRENDQRFSDLSQQVKSVLDAVQKQGGQATPEQQQQLEQVSDDLAELTELQTELEGVDEFDTISAASGKKLLGVIRKLADRKPSGSSIDDAEIEKRVAQTLEKREQERQQQEQQRRQAVSEFQQQFRQDHPQVADRFEELARQAHQDVAARFGARPLTPDQRQVALEMAFDQRVAEAEQAAQSGSQTKPPASKPATTPPPRSTKGTATTVPGAANRAVPSEADWSLPGDPSSGITAEDLY